MIFLSLDLRRYSSNPTFNYLSWTSYTRQIHEFIREIFSFDFQIWLVARFFRCAMTHITGLLIWFYLLFFILYKLLVGVACLVFLLLSFNIHVYIHFTSINNTLINKLHFSRSTCFRNKIQMIWQTTPVVFCIESLRNYHNDYGFFELKITCSKKSNGTCDKRT